MTIIGISMTHDGTISVVRDGISIFAIGEERLNRIKAYIGFPFKGLDLVISSRIIEPGEVDAITISGAKYIKEWAGTFAFVLNERKKYYDIQNETVPQDYYVDDTEWQQITTDSEMYEYVKRKLRAIFDGYGIHAPILFLDHHLSHAASAYYSSGLDEALAVTMDGEGDFLSASVNICRKGAIEKIHDEPVSSSFGYLYSKVTWHCGFKINRHEGKITGLAAYGDYRKKQQYFLDTVKADNGRVRYVLPGGGSSCGSDQEMPIMAVCDSIIKNSGISANADLAASVQNILELRIGEFIDFWVKKTGIGDVVLAGGTFANVKFNQKISELESVKSVYIHPDMGDGGNAYGSAMLHYHSANKYAPDSEKIKDVYFGPGYDDASISDVLNNYRETVEFRRAEDVEKETARLVAGKYIIGWFQGRMEYGPRALGNRSILASPVDASINKWLNDRLKRTEFMPFAPSCLYEFADEVFEIPGETLKYPAEFMTITFNMKPEWITKAPAVAHIDGTARPQLVREAVNPRYHRVLREYHALTGLPLFINTSFNAHEEPIVCTPEDAVKPLLYGMIDYLVIGDFICRKKQ